MRTALHKKLETGSEGRMLSSIEKSILKVLAYFDIFQYPLQKVEISSFLDENVAREEMDNYLLQLTQEGYIYFFNNLYSLQNNPLLVHRRNQGNLRAGRLLPKAMRIGRFLCRFPFVRAVGVSGSLSKYFADEKADIDFFIITSANRLWIARTIMHLFKKLTFLVGRQHFYCMNYYVDESSLLLEDQNIYTAIEIKTLVPVSGKKALDDFFSINDWSNEFLPVIPGGADLCGLNDYKTTRTKRSWLKQFTEWLLNNTIGDRLDDYLLKITSRRWKRKELRGKRNQKGHVMGLITSKHFSKSDPESFQEKVLSLYNQKLSDLRIEPAGKTTTIKLSFEE